MMQPHGANSPLVSVHMPAYNHEAYIAQALESALAQVTNFDFEIVVGEDCSTDGTRAVARDYAGRHPGRIVLIENERNLGIWENDRRIVDRCRGEFIAWLESDDYWCVQDKLQRQVDMLASHPGMSACFHRVRPLSAGALPASWRNGPGDSKPIYTLDDLLEQGHFVPSCSAVFRSSHVREPRLWTRATPFLEVTYFAYLATQGDIGFIDEEMAVFRYHERGVYGQSSRTEQARLALDAHRLIGRHLGLERRESFRQGLARLARQFDLAQTSDRTDTGGRQ